MVNINCILDSELHKKVLANKRKLQLNSNKNITLTDSVVDLLEKGLKK